jgi:hypothetical protein
MHCIYLIALLFLGIIPCFGQFIGGTTIIMYESPMGLFIGADSRASDSGGVLISAPFCKIHVSGDTIIYFSTGISMTRGVYYSDSVVWSALKNHNSAQRSIMVLRKKMMATQQWFNDTFRGDSLKMQSIFPFGDLFDIVIIERCNDKFVYRYIRFKIRMETGKFLIDCDAKILNMTNRIAYFGYANLARSLHIDMSRKTPIEIGEMIYKMIERQCADPSGATGKPIFVVWWNRSGELTWVGDPNPCFH